ncbi:2-phospho-L-lactate guanylyltransferase [Patulibacter defluvii]|uniref:2-phospho-L-lactate guanylyltransferase n=1 Tax=Patulibacter defluvii TaxID=3095358 RepID=UPI002A75C871|nr:2-phospho-L-lactate guanylyltransferase [Patulibacter sp. DM4]
MRTIAIVPVKRFSNAKQRLADVLPARSRVALMQAMVTDVLIALRRSQLVEGVIVVTGEPVAEQIAVNYNAEVLPDAHDLGHSEAVAAGIQWALGRGAERVLLVPGDCPTLDPSEVDGLLAADPHDGPEVTIVPDRHGSGTNALVLTPPDVMPAAFGEGSRARHAEAAKAAGAAVFEARPETLLLDVDTREDLEALQARLDEVRGGASHTRGLLPRIL